MPRGSAMSAVPPEGGKLVMCRHAERGAKGTAPRGGTRKKPGRNPGLSSFPL